MDDALPSVVTTDNPVIPTSEALDKFSWAVALTVILLSNTLADR